MQLSSVRIAPLLVSTSLLGALPSVLASPIVPPPAASFAGTAFCRETSAQPAACQVGWRWQGKPGAYVWIQQFEPSTGTWRNLAVAPATRTGVSQDTVEEGHLYRAFGCDDLRGQARCASTTAFWAPYRPATVNDIPEVVADRYGTRFSVAKNTPYVAQVSEYNAYQLMLHLEGLDRSGLPAMTEPRPITVADWSVWDNVAYNIYELYEGYRKVDTENNARPASEAERPDWWHSDVVR